MEQPANTAAAETAADVIKKTVFVENLRISVEKLALKMKTQFTETFGENAVTSLVKRKDGYEITFASEEAAKECAINGLLLDNRQYDAVSCANQELVVTLYPVPAYVEDDAIKAKLTELNCEVIGDIKRSQIQGIETGRRKVVVKLPPNTRSLPRALIVKSVNNKDERIELYHRNQRLRKNTREYDDNRGIVITLSQVPAYVEDDAIKAKLIEMNCEVIGDITRSQIQGIETGRRKAIVVLPPSNRFLPRSIVVRSTNNTDERIELFQRNRRRFYSTSR